MSVIACSGRSFSPWQLTCTPARGRQPALREVSMKHEWKTAVNDGRSRVAPAWVRRYRFGAVIVAIAALAVLFAGHNRVRAAGPTVLDPNLAVRAVVTG